METPDAVAIQLLGGLTVQVGAREITEADWPTRRASELVALLALTPGRRLMREQVIELLWPHLGPEPGAANLRKAAHHARKVLGDQDAVVLKGGAVELLPGHDVRIDVDELLATARSAQTAQECARVAALAPGELLPSLPYEVWTQEPRRQVHATLADLVRRSGDLERLMALEPTDEATCQELMRRALAEGRRHVAIRWYEALRLAMVRELGLQPGAESRALYDECTAGVRLGEPVFVGRAEEAARAMALLQQTALGGTRALVVRGSAGIGKSALCRELSDRAAARGWRVLTVRATGADAPYAPIGTAIEQLLVGGRAGLDDLPVRTRSILAELSPSARPAPPLTGALTRHQVVAALRRALALRADAPPTLLRVEDAHLADEATADVLHQLVAGGGDGALLVVLAVRGELMRTSLPAGLVELTGHEATHTLTLGPLTDADVRDLVAPAVSDAADVDGIVEAAGGSPFFALELARDTTAGLPPTLGDAVRARFNGLEDAVVELAVSPRDLDLASVLALTGAEEDAAFALLDAALDAGVLVVSGTRYRFRHELIRLALLDELAPHRRVALHRRAAERLAAAGAPAEQVAEQWLQGGRPDDAVPWLLTATRGAMAVGAFADALRDVTQLLAHAPAHHEGLCLKAEILDALGDAGAPDAYAAAAAAVGPPEDQELRARQALAQLKASDPDSALRTLEGVTPVSVVGRLAEALTLSAAAAIGRYADADTAAAKADEAHKLALELGDPGAVLDATWAHALAAHARGELPARLREYLRATQHLPEIATRVFDGQLCVTERMLYGGLPSAEVIAFADGLAEEAQRLGAARGHAFACTLRGEALILAGRLDEADRDFSDGARLHGQIGAAAGEALSLLGRAQVATYRGTPELARPHLDHALLMARESEVGHHTLDRIYGAMVSAARDPAQALEVVLQAETAIQGPAETCPTCRIAYIVPATIAAAQAGDLDRARRYAQDCDRALEIVALPPAWHAAVEEARGWVARAEAREDDATEHFARAAEGFAAWDQPLDAARCAALADAGNV